MAPQQPTAVTPAPGAPRPGDGSRSRDAAGPTPRDSRALALVEAMRPAQWTKNAFVLAGLIFSASFTDADAVLRTAVAFVAFCLASSATYLLNDAFDAETDRNNPRTAGRPIARGALSRRTGFTASAVFAVAALAMVAPLNWETPAVVGGYLVLQVAYSMGLKHLVLLDVLAVSLGFVLRALAGAVAIPVVISEWLLLCTGLLALFLALAKRRGELLALGPGAGTRRVLDDYTPELVEQLITITAPITVIAYAIYCVTAASTPAMAITLPFVLYGLFRYLFLAQRRGVGEEPGTAALHDRPLGLAVVLWGITAGVITAIAGAA
ncbi:MAG: decaprenyl-phosphate phosphoribosyltransferase [Solirubrobacterales bacterium]